MDLSWKIGDLTTFALSDRLNSEIRMFETAVGSGGGGSVGGVENVCSEVIIEGEE